MPNVPALASFVKVSNPIVTFQKPTSSIANPGQPTVGEAQQLANAHHVLRKMLKLYVEALDERVVTDDSLRQFLGSLVGNRGELSGM